ncbi:MAG TPA: type IV toxin-antitoxin system AbiEi family antitoxin domain-containing protein [Propionibacteriaceae bacterium]|nr:type IV toxin-antitoxin system AbiEi family antitoxin domain-containing protein [Propionibacteriaceae bacterium]
MDEGFVVRLCRDLHEEGYGAAEVAKLVASGQLKRIRRGGYAAKAASNAVELHRQLIAATVPMWRATPA